METTRITIHTISQRNKVPYHDRLRFVNLPTVKFAVRWVITFKISNGIMMMLWSHQIFVFHQSHTDLANSVKIIGYRLSAAIFFS